MNAATLPSAPGQELQQLPQTYQPQSNNMQYEVPKAAASSDNAENYSGHLRGGHDEDRGCLSQCIRILCCIALCEIVCDLC